MMHKTFFKEIGMFLSLFLLVNNVIIDQAYGFISETESETEGSTKEQSAYLAAAHYSRVHNGVSMVVLKDGQVVFQDYPTYYYADDAHTIFSGTKSFSCAIAVAAAEDWLLSFDEPVSETITEWQNDPQKSKITIRQLLTLTSGINAGVVGVVPLFEYAIYAPMSHPPGSKFQYGPVPFQIFGELMQRKLSILGETVSEYLTRRVFNPIGLNVAFWHRSIDGNPKMSSGVYLTALEWAKYGQLLLNEGRWGDNHVLDKDLLSECYRGTEANPGYGMTFWLPHNSGIDSKDINIDPVVELNSIHAPGPIIKASGLGGQRLYVIPKLNLVIVRQSSLLPLGGWGFDEAEFLAPIFELHQSDTGI
jgi:CubicO group peptidase (beta-lactamase class C family)